MCLVAEDIPEVGLGELTPICDFSSTSECVTSDQDAQEELVDELEADDQLTGERTVDAALPALYSWLLGFARLRFTRSSNPGRQSSPSTTLIISVMSNTSLLSSAEGIWKVRKLQFFDVVEVAGRVEGEGRGLSSPHMMGSGQLWWPGTETNVHMAFSLFLADVVLSIRRHFGADLADLSTRVHRCSHK